MFKRVLSLCVALVLVVGASSGDLFAQEMGDIRIEVMSPADSGAVIKIGTEIKVYVYAILGQVDTVEVALGGIEDASSATTFGNIGTLKSAGFNPNVNRSSSEHGLGGGDSDPGVGTKVDTFKVTIVAMGEEAFDADPTDDQISAKTAPLEVHVRFAKAGRDKDGVRRNEDGAMLSEDTGTDVLGDDDFIYVKNSSTDDTDVEGGGEIGDKKKFSLDLTRPGDTEDAFVTGVALKGSRKVGGSGEDKDDETRKFPADSTLQISTIRAARTATQMPTILDDAVVLTSGQGAEVLMVSPEAIEAIIKMITEDNNKSNGVLRGLSEGIMRALVHKDSSFYRIESFSFDRTGVLVKDPVKAKAETFGNDVKFGLLAFTTDDVGNLANDAYFQSDGEVDNGDEADSDPLIYTVDGILPTVNIVNPQEGGRFTAAKLSAGEAYIDTTEGKRITMEDHMFGQNPLKIKIDEDISEIEVTLGTAKAPVMSISDLKRAEDDSTVIVEITDYKGPDGEDGEGEDKDETKPDGDELKVKVTVEDEVGNKSKAVEVTATFDNVPLEISDVFPRFPESEAVIDTVTTETVDVSLAISEDADSISVRWFQYKKDDPQGSILEPKIGIAKDIPKGDVDDRFDDFTFGDDDNNKTFTLQIFARDKAGNVTLTEPDTLFFSEEFKNPVADTFLVTRPKGSDDKVLPDSSIVGQELTLNIEARTKGEKGKTAVTYDDQAKDNDVLVSVLVLNEEMEHVLADSGRFTISEDLEEGVKNTVNMDGTVSLNRKGWDLGKRTITVTTDTAVAMVIVKVEDTSTQTRTDQDTPEETTMERVPNFGGDRDSLVWEAGEFVQFRVSVTPDGDDSGNFMINVVPTDSLDNPSTKTSTIGDEDVDINANEGREFLTSRLDPKYILDEVSFEFGSPNTRITLPDGPQGVGVEGDGSTSEAMRPPGSL